MSENKDVPVHTPEQADVLTVNQPPMYHGVWFLKHVLGGVQTLEDAAEILAGEAEHLAEMSDNNVWLEHTTGNCAYEGTPHFHLATNDAGAALMYGLCDGNGKVPQGIEDAQKAFLKGERLKPILDIDPDEGRLNLHKELQKKNRENTHLLSFSIRQVPGTPPILTIKLDDKPIGPLRNVVFRVVDWVPYIEFTYPYVEGLPGATGVGDANLLLQSLEAVAKLRKAFPWILVKAAGPADGLSEHDHAAITAGKLSEPLATYLVECGVDEISKVPDSVLEDVRHILLNAVGDTPVFPGGATHAEYLFNLAKIVLSRCKPIETHNPAATAPEQAKANKTQLSEEMKKLQEEDALWRKNLAPSTNNYLLIGPAMTAFAGSWNTQHPGHNIVFRAKEDTLTTSIIYHNKEVTCVGVGPSWIDALSKTLAAFENSITNVPTPIDSTDVANKAYVDLMAQWAAIPVEKER